MEFDVKKVPQHLRHGIVKQEFPAHERNGSLLREVNERFSCDVCNMEFTDEALLAAHIELHVLCPYCGRRFRTEQGFKVHVGNVHRGLPWCIKPGPIRCTSCDVVFENLEALQVHAKAEHQVKKPKRAYAKKSVATLPPPQAAAVDLPDGGESSKNIDCTICGEKFSSTTNLVDHILSNHVNRETPSHDPMQVCSYCDMTFRDKKVLQLHVTNRHKGLPTDVKGGSISSKICNVVLEPIKVTVNVEKPENNAENQPESSTANPVCCNVCGEKFKDKQSLMDHMLFMHSNFKEIESVPAVEVTEKEQEETATDFILSLQRGDSEEKSLPKSDELVRCSYCDVLLVNSDRLKVHVMETHKGLPTYATDDPISSKLCFVVLNRLPEEKETNECEFCSEVFPDTNAQIDHIMDVHVGKSYTTDLHHEEVYGCEQCDEVFYDEVKLKSHKFLKHMWNTEALYAGEGPFSCFKCGKFFPQRHKIEGHLLRHEGLTTLECPKCSKKFSNRYNLKQHYLLIHTRTTPFNCDVCNRKFRSRPILNSHKLLHEEKAEECPYCLIVCGNFSRLKTHVRTYHKGLPAKIINVDEPIDCRVCRMSFGNLKALKVHAAQQHTLEKSCICKMCGNIFSNLAEKRLHIKENHLKKKKTKDNTPVECNECGRILSNKRVLKLHMMAHTNTIECQKCNKKFQHKSKFRHHLKGCNRRQRQLDIIYSLKCPYCRCKCKNMERLEHHVTRFHAGLPVESTDGPVECTICKTTFETLELLKEHVGVEHPVEKPFECIICEEAFVNEEEMEKHMAEVHESEIFRCDQCEKIFTNKGTFLRHMDVHNPIAISRRFNTTTLLDYECEKCGLKFSNKLTVKLHIFRYHAIDITQSYRGKGPYKCKECGKVLVRRYTLKRHLLKHNNSGGIECTKCSRRFLSTFDLKLHMTRHSNKRPFKCLVCKRTFKTKLILQRHNLSIHNGQIEECSYCGVKRKNIVRLKEHVRRYHKGLPTENKDSGPIKCTICRMLFDGLEGLKEHCATEHPCLNPHKCNMCGERFISKEELGDHREQSHYEKIQKILKIRKRVFTKEPFKRRPKRPNNPRTPRTVKPKPLLKYECEKCGLKFKTKIRVKIHIIRKHMNTKIQSYTGNGPYKCKECGKILVYKYSLERHLLTHDGSLGIKCSKCPKNFLSEFDLKIHMKVHRKRKPLKCKICGWSFKRLANFKKHRAVHTKEPKVCPYCDMTCLHPRHFRRHIRTFHNGLPLQVQDDGPLDCNSCNSTFEHLEALKEHCSVEHPCAKPFRCVTCKERFVNKQQYEDHLQQNEDCKMGQRSGRDCKEGIKITVNSTCNLCGKNMGNKYSLERHMGVIHRIGGKFECPICTRKFVHNSEFKRHLKTCHKNRMEDKNCPHCNVILINDDRLEKHVSRLHPGLPSVIQDGPIQCTVCGESFKILEVLKEHTGVQHPVEKPFECLSCGETFALEEEKEKHMQDAHGNLPSDLPCICGKCGKVLSSKYTLERHLAMHERIKHCSICSKEFLYLIEYRRHLKQCRRTNRKQNYIRCAYCTRKCSNRERLERHVDRFHIGLPVDIPDGPTECTICRTSFETLDVLKEHISAEHIISNKECEYCDDSFATEEDLNYHTRQIHTSVDLEFKCEKCGVEFDRKVQLKVHMMKHFKGKVQQNTKRSFDCEKCGKVLANRGSFSRHMKLHSGKLEVVCPNCSKRFVSRTDLKRHMSVHSDTRPFLCKICKKAFKAPQNLKRHLFLHITSIEECLYCEMKCSNTDRLKCHMRKYHKGLPMTLTGDGPVNCVICKKSFEALEALKEHAAIEHPSHQLTPLARRNGLQRLNLSKFRNYLPCSYCPIKCRTRERLEEHVNRVHKGLPVDGPGNASISSQACPVAVQSVEAEAAVGDREATDNVQHHSHDNPAQWQSKARAVKQEIDTDVDGVEFLITELEVNNYVLQHKGQVESVPNV